MLPLNVTTIPQISRHKAVQPTDGDLLLVFSDRDCKDRKPYSPGSGHRKPALAGRLKLTNSAILPVRTIRSPNFGFWAAIVPGVALAIASTPVLAEIQVRGNPEAVRIEARDTIVTSQLPVDHCHEVIVDPTIADAVLDRLVHTAHRLALDGETLRKPPEKSTKRGKLDTNTAA